MRHCIVLPRWCECFASGLERDEGNRSLTAARDRVLLPIHLKNALPTIKGTSMLRAGVTVNISDNISSFLWVHVFLVSATHFLKRRYVADLSKACTYL